MWLLDGLRELCGEERAGLGGLPEESYRPRIEEDVSCGWCDRERTQIEVVVVGAMSVCTCSIVRLSPTFVSKSGVRIPYFSQHFLSSRG